MRKSLVNYVSLDQMPNLIKLAAVCICTHALACLDSASKMISNWGLNPVCLSNMEMTFFWLDQEYMYISIDFQNEENSLLAWVIWIWLTGWWIRSEILNIYGKLSVKLINKNTLNSNEKFEDLRFTSLLSFWEWDSVIFHMIFTFN